MIPDEEKCLSLLRKYNTPEHIILHSIRVWQVAKLLGDALLLRNHQLDMELVRASSLLHDIGKYPCIVEGKGYHDKKGEEILESEGYPAVADVVVQHVVLRSRLDPIAEPHLIFYADKRVVHDVVVSLDDRFDYLEKTYGRTREAVRRLMVMKEETRELEDRIFLLLDFSPLEVISLLI